MAINIVDSNSNLINSTYGTVCSYFGSLADAHLDRL